MSFATEKLPWTPQISIWFWYPFAFKLIFTSVWCSKVPIATTCL